MKSHAELASELAQIDAKLSAVAIYISDFKYQAVGLAISDIREIISCKANALQMQYALDWMVEVDFATQEGQGVVGGIFV